MPPEQRHHVDLARTSAESLLEILDDILDAAKVESGQLHLETIPFRPREEFSRVLETMQFRAGAKSSRSHGRSTQPFRKRCSAIPRASVRYSRIC
ncbi:MAG: hypothetical protein QM760_15530 [Nibricoccus sp.]